MGKFYFAFAFAFLFLLAFASSLEAVDYKITDNFLVESSLDSDVDSSGTPYLVFERGGDVYFVQGVGQEEFLDEGIVPSIFLNEEDIPYVLYTSGVDLMLAYENEDEWVFEVLAEGVSPTSSDIALDLDGNVHVVYSKRSSENYDDIIYLNNVGGDFVSSNICHGYYWSGWGGQYCGHPVGIDVDSDGKYHISYVSGWRDSTPSYSVYAMSYATNALGGGSSSPGFSWGSVSTNKNSISLDSDENARIVYMRGGHVYSVVAGAASWSEADFATGLYGSIYSGDEGDIITYYDSGKVYYSLNEGDGFGPHESISQAGTSFFGVVEDFSVYYLNSSDNEIYLKSTKAFDSVAPFVFISSHEDNDSVFGVVDVVANASDGEGVGVSEVEFWHSGSDDGAFVDGVFPYGFSWNTTLFSDGEYYIWAVAYDYLNNFNSSEKVRVFVDNCHDEDGDGYFVTYSGGNCELFDCDDSNSSINPNATEIVGDFVDQDCNGFDKVVCYEDNDEDGFGNSSLVYAEDGYCNKTEGESYNSNDCDDSNFSINPNASEIVGDFVDQDCNGFDKVVCYEDNDEDGFGNSLVYGVLGDCDFEDNLVEESGDCDDGNFSINPNSSETVGDGVDFDCDLEEICFSDFDNDGYANSSVFVSLDLDCSDLGEAWAFGFFGDCNNLDSSVNPSVNESCNGFDDNCDGEVDEGFLDLDNDSFADCVDLDDDGDGVLDEVDNCEAVFNSDQMDSDSDGFGDSCDNCLNVFNSDQMDSDSDGLGDSCDPTPYGDVLAPETFVLANNGTYESGEIINGDVFIEFECEDDESGCNRTEYYLKNYGYIYSSDGGEADFDWEIYNDSLIIDSEGRTVVYYRSIDNVGNVAEYGYFEVRLDSVAAVGNVSAFMENGEVYSFGSWTNQSVRVVLECEDSFNGSGVRFVNYSLNGVFGENHFFDRTSFSASRDIPRGGEILIDGDLPGNYEIRYSCVDNAGNVESFSIRYVRILAYFEGGAFEFPENATPYESPNVTVGEDFSVEVPTGNGTSRVKLKKGTVITSSSGEVNLSEVSGDGDVNRSLLGFDNWMNLEGVIQWGVLNLGLYFSEPIEIEIYVGEDYNNQTIDVRRSVDGVSGSWTQDGIEEPRSCLVEEGVCRFNATKASYYAATTGEEPVDVDSSSRRHSSGGSLCSTRWTCSEWSECNNYFETRTCGYPSGYCEPEVDKPSERRVCVPILEDVIDSFVSDDDVSDEGGDESGIITGAVVGGSGSGWFWAIGFVLVVGLGLGFVWFKRNR